MPFIPHTDEDIKSMLHTIGVKKIDDLFCEIPEKLQTNLHNKLAPGINELAINKLMQKRSDQDYGISNYIGAGAYEHHIPAAVWDIAGRGEFMTSYTPYQAEASQGNLQLIYEYQTMICNLTGMDVSNASLYDGASGLAEAILMSVRANKKSHSRTVLLLGALHPDYLSTVTTIVSHQNIELVVCKYNPQSGTTTLDELNLVADIDCAAVVVTQPNFFGQLEDIHMITDWAHAKQALLIAVVNPTSLALLEAPGNWGEQGADIVCGEGQPLGVPLASGGPYFGFMCCKKDLARQMPGRIVGRTVDLDGKQGFTLTLQAREQHIRRSKATSNICTNQGLLVTAATIYMSLLGANGLRNVAEQSYRNMQFLTDQLCRIPGIRKKYTGYNFHEVVLEFDRPVAPIIKKLHKHKIAAGLNLQHYLPDVENCLLVCTTETKDLQDLEYYVSCMHNIIQES